MLTERFAEFRKIVEQYGATTVGEKSKYGKSAISKVYNGRYDANPEKIITAALTAFNASDSGGEDVPDGYMQDSKGRLVPVNLVKKIDVERDELVLAIMQKAVVAATKMKLLRQDILRQIEAFCKRSAEHYGKGLGGLKGNIQLPSYDGKFKILRAVEEHFEFDERLQVAKELIDQCLKEWTEGGRDEIKVIVNDAFQVDQAGRVNTKRILGLRRHDIKDERWKKAMQSISDSICVTASKTYLRFYERDESGKYRQISVGI